MTTAKVDLDAAVAHYIQLRDYKAKLEAEHKARIAEINQQMTNAENYFLHYLNESGQSGCKFPAGSLVVKTKTQTNLKDRAAFLEFVRSTGQIELLQTRVSSTAVSEFMETNNNQLPPGVEVTQVRAVEIRRPRS